MMSNPSSAPSTPSPDVPSCHSQPFDVSSHHSQSLPDSQDNMFHPDSNNSGYTYIAPNPNGRVSPINTSGIDMIDQVYGTMENWTASLGPVEDWPHV